jgi:hypothetical protein
MMTAAMAFFSIAFTLNFMLNQTGVKLSSIRVADLRPTTIATTVKNGFYVADKNVMRYYDNLRFVYEVESRVRELKREAEPQGGGTPAPTKTNPDAAKPVTKPAAKPNNGSAERRVPAPQQMGEPVEARCERGVSGQPVRVSPMHCRLGKAEKNHGTSMRAERSLA